MNWAQNKIHTAINTSVGILILLFPAFLVSVDNAGGLIILLLTLLSSAGLIINQSKIPLHKSERHFLLAIGFFLLIYVFNIIYFDLNISEFDNPSRFLLLLPIFFYLRKIKLNINYILYSLFLGVLGCLILALYQKYSLEMDRSVGVSGVVSFGAICMSLAMMSLPASLLSTSKLTKTMMILSVFIGVYASILTGTRGAWLILPASIILILVINPLQLKKLTIAYLFTFIFITIGALYFIPLIQNRVDTAISDIINYYHYGEIQSSLGARLDIWHIAIGELFKNPLLGIGQGNFLTFYQNYVKTNNIPSALTTDISHLHNEYISAAFHRGIFGLISMILIFFTPLIHLLISIKNQTGDKQILSLTTIILISSCLVISLSDAFFDQHPLTLFFVALIYILYSQIYTDPKEQTKL